LLILWPLAEKGRNEAVQGAIADQNVSIHGAVMGRNEAIQDAEMGHNDGIHGAEMGYNETVRGFTMGHNDDIHRADMGYNEAFRGSTMGHNYGIYGAEMGYNERGSTMGHNFYSQNAGMDDNDAVRGTVVKYRNDGQPVVSLGTGEDVLARIRTSVGHGENVLRRARSGKLLTPRCFIHLLRLWLIAENAVDGVVGGQPETGKYLMPQLSSFCQRPIQAATSGVRMPGAPGMVIGTDPTMSVMVPVVPIPGKLRDFSTALKR
jgi:hypothetical protein